MTSAPAPSRTDVVTIHLDDAVLADGLADVRWLLHDALLAGARQLVVDLSGVQHLSSSAVASFLSAHRTCRARGGAVVVAGAAPRTCCTAPACGGSWSSSPRGPWREPSPFPPGGARCPDRSWCCSSRGWWSPWSAPS